jgi:hypothetical protein
MQLTTNTRAFIEAEQYSDFILMNLHDGLLPESFYRNVSDFGSGETLHIKTVGTVTLQEGAEDTPLTYNPIETGEITLTITEYKGDAWYVSDKLREDGTNIDRLMAERSMESTRAFQEVLETDFLKAGAEVYQATSGPFNVNGFAHKIVSAETNDVFALSHLIAMKLAFDKANVPAGGRVFICDPTVEATLNGLVTITNDVTEFGKMILEGGWERDNRFVMNLFGWNIITSNRLHKPAAAVNDGTNSIAANGVYNMFMCVLDDQTKPIMHAVRRQIRVEGERNKDYNRDEFVASSRYGFGVQRVDTLGCLVTDSTQY